MTIEDAIKVYDDANANPTQDSIGPLIKATQLMAKRYRDLADEGLTRNAADRFDEWKLTKAGRRIVGVIGESAALETFAAGAYWAPSKIVANPYSDPFCK